ncbi:MAG: hypothetical protein LBR98_10220 [Syntrophomonadaceae bacterium]|jgi:hypothetical protein|nr:hypothetical protein [Syntrophomonadaceae bacterium]
MHLILKFKDGSLKYFDINNPSSSMQKEIFELLQNVSSNNEGVIQLDGEVKKLNELYSIETVY